MRFSSRFSLLVATFAFLISISPSISLSAANEAGTGGLTITRIFTGWKEGASFKRISEYFNGKENTGGITVLRTYPDSRSGFYFLTRVANPGPPVAVTIAIELITPTDSHPKTYTFTAELKSGGNILNLGLTGPDWPDEKANPVAWKMDFKDSSDQVLVSQKSYLWEKPDTK